MPDYGAIIAGTGSCLPEKRLTNDDLSKIVDTNDEWITQRTGIKERRVVSVGESTASLSTNAAKRAPIDSSVVARLAGVAGLFDPGADEPVELGQLCAGTEMVDCARVHR